MCRYLITILTAVIMTTHAVAGGDDCESQFQSAVEELEAAHSENQSRLLRGEISEYEFEKIKAELVSKHNELAEQPGYNPDVFSKQVREKKTKAKQTSGNTYPKANSPLFYNELEPVYYSPLDTGKGFDNKKFTLESISPSDDTLLIKEGRKDTMLALDSSATSFDSYRRLKSSEKIRWTLFSNYGHSYLASGSKSINYHADVNSNTKPISLKSDFGAILSLKEFSKTLINAHAVVFSPDGELIYSRRPHNGKIQIWNSGQERPHRTYKSYESATWANQKDKEAIVARKSDKYILKELRSRSEKVLFSLSSIEDYVGIDLNHQESEALADFNGENLWLIYDSGYLVRWNFRQKKFVDSIELPAIDIDGDVGLIYLDYSGKYIGFEYEVGKIKILNLYTGDEFAIPETDEFQDFYDLGLDGHFSFDGRYFIVPYGEKHKLYRITGGKAEGVIK